MVRTAAFHPIAVFPDDDPVMSVFWRRLLPAMVVLVAAAAWAAPAPAGMDDPLASRLTAEVVQSLHPTAALGPIEGDPPVAALIENGERVGYAFSTHETVRPQGYSGESFDIMVGLGLDYRITGVRVVEVHEPMIGPNLIPVERLSAYLDSLVGIDIRRPIRMTGGRGVDGVAGATISATAMHGAIIQSARKVARLKGLIDTAGGPLMLDRDSYESLAWSALVDLGAVAKLHVSEADVRGDSGAGDDAPLIDLYTAIATPAGIGRNLFGDKWYNHHLAQLELGEHLLVVMGDGRYSWRGPTYQMRDTFERVQIVQGEQTLRLDKANLLRHTAIRAEGAPRLSEIGLFRLSPESGFDVLKPWRLELLVETEGAAQDGEEASPKVFDLPYRMPVRYVLGEDADLEAAGLKEPEYALFGLVRKSALDDWQRTWLERSGAIAGLVGLLTVLTGILFFQETIARRRRLHAAVRIGFLAVVVVWLGFLMDAQLTVINVLNYVAAGFNDHDWTTFLIDPLIFILSVYVALTLILWGRGVFCGWLCPFGALQELLNRAARLVRVPQLKVAETVQARLWTVKYVIALGIFVLAIYSMESAAKAAEVEPFKTAIIMGFERAWPYALYAGALLFAGLFVERFFCRYLCPLGGALTVFGRLHLLNWLRRRPQCGNPCRICETSCPIGAIDSTGNINMNECFQCLDCQVDYFDDHTCPPLIARRLRNSRGC